MTLYTKGMTTRIITGASPFLPPRNLLNSFPKYIISAYE